MARAASAPEILRLAALIPHPGYRLGEVQVRAGDDDTQTFTWLVGQDGITPLALPRGIGEVEAPRAHNFIFPM
jgi:hypothetical protein